MSIIESARGRWHEILPIFGIDSKFLRKKHGPCPCCGGKDRFIYDNKEGRGTYHCNQCGAGSGFQLLMLVRGWSMSEACKEVGRIVETVERKLSTEPERTDEAKRQAMNDAWMGAHPVREGDPVYTYLNKRIGPVAASNALRTHAKLMHFEELKTFPAMLAKVSDPANKPVSIHRTYLTEAGEKAACKPNKMLMAGHIPDGSAIRLLPYADVLGITEGIETALSCYELFGVPCWSAISASMLVKWKPPQGLRTIVIFGDNDHNFAGQLASYRLAWQIRRDDPDVKIVVAFPYIGGADWNDLMMLEPYSVTRAIVKETYPTLPILK